jgi:hypothetical protein
MFKDSIHQDFQLISSSPANHRYAALGLIIRGNVTFSVEGILGYLLEGCCQEYQVVEELVGYGLLE